MRRVMGPFAATVMAALAVAACGGDDDNGDNGNGGSAKDGGKSGEVVRVAIGKDPAFAHVYLAEAERLFEKAGLNAEVVLTDGGPLPTQAIVDGEADIATNGDSSAMLLMADAPTLRALAVTEASSDYLKLVLGPGVKKPQDIRRMATINGVGMVATLRYLESEGIPRDQVELVNAEPSEFATLLGKGKVDAFILFTPYVEQGVAQGGRIAGTIEDFGALYTQWLIADEAWLETHGDTAATVAKVIGQANEMVTADTERAAKATEAKIGVPVADSMKGIPEIDFRLRDFNDEDLAFYDKTVKFYLQEGIMKTAPDLDTIIQPGWLPANVAASG